MREQQSQLKASRSVIDVAMTLTANLQGQNLHYNITLLARQLVPCEWSTLYLLDEQSNRLYQLKEDGSQGMVIKTGEGVAGSVAQTLTIGRLSFPRSDPRFTAGHYGERAGRVREILAFPVTDSHGSLKAVLELVNRVGVNAFTREDESELTPFCSLAGITLHNSRTLQVARRTQTAARLERRGSMMGVRRTSETDARNDPLAAAKLASAEFEGKKSRRTSRETDLSAEGEEQGVVELGLLSQRKHRASIF